MEAENQGQVSSKLESSMKREKKKLRARRKLVKKCEEARGSTETFSKLQSSEEPRGKAVNPPKASTKQLLFGKKNMDTEVLPRKNNMEAGNQGEASSKPESSTKRTPRMLKPRPNIVKKSLANESLKANMASGAFKVHRRNRRKNKMLNSREETTEKNVTNKLRNEGNLEIKNKERVRGSDKRQQNQRSERKHGGSDKSSMQKDKENRDGIEKSQQNEMNKLGGLIFMCSAKTKPDCFHYRLMGVSMNKKDLVLGIKPGLKLFLYDFDLKLLYGIYKASSPGGLNIERRAFGGAFPVQVRFDIHKDCLPLPESVFRKAIKENYNEKQKFKTELTVKQVRKLSELFRTLPSPGHSPAMPDVRDGESYVRVRELRPHSGRERVGRDPYVNDNGRSYPILPRERREHIAYQEITPQQREEISSDRYLREKEYRAYGLQGERRNLTPPRHVAPSLHHAAPILDPYERDHAREHLSRQPDLIYRDTVSVHRESNRADPLYFTESEYQAYKLGAKLELHTGTGTGTVLDHYKRDPYNPFHHGASSVDSYRLPVHRNEVSSGTYSPGGRIATYPGEMDRLQREPEQVDRLYSTYAADALSNYNRISHHQGAPRETAPAPVSSWYSFAGPSQSYR
ncbi:hypothetical protein HS088_TW06G01153 [Tripterygium wilfordii]|uniref:DCD domain-containing protein n=2 Tax=Tripterygium wilfordii TaxID=458696 RepID=A0A7J7DLL3_TRIWF|nr:hypothetical protein HS088_TW06G01153 [Tripterygium wilfordii]